MKPGRPIFTAFLVLSLALAVAPTGPASAQINQPTVIDCDVDDCPDQVSACVDGIPYGLAIDESMFIALRGRCSVKLSMPPGASACSRGLKMYRAEATGMLTPTGASCSRPPAVLMRERNGDVFQVVTSAAPANTCPGGGVYRSADLPGGVTSIDVTVSQECRAFLATVGSPGATCNYASFLNLLSGFYFLGSGIDWGLRAVETATAGPETATSASFRLPKDTENQHTPLIPLASMNQQLLCVDTQGRREFPLPGDNARLYIELTDLDSLSAFEQLSYRPDLNRDHSTVLRLYWAVFDRTPDVGGARFWIDAYNSGDWSIRRIASYFSISPEFVDTYGASLTDTEFVELLYRNVLVRQPDAAGEVFWIGQLQAGMLRAEMILLVSNSPEFIENHPLPSDFAVPADCAPDC